MDVETIAKLTLAQRDIMLGHMVEIPPEDCDELIALGLKGEEYFDESGAERRMVWPITRAGLQVRAALQENHDG